MSNAKVAADAAQDLARANELLASTLGPLTWTPETRGPKLCRDDDAEIVSVAALEDGEGRFNFGDWVEGEVVDVFDGRGRWFFNFGDDYKSDFTISLKGEALTKVRRYWPKPGQWIGRTVRVRGYGDRWNGWLVEWDFPGQVCFVGGVPYRG